MERFHVLYPDPKGKYGQQRAGEVLAVIESKGELVFVIRDVKSNDIFSQPIFLCTYIKSYGDIPYDLR